MVANNLEDHAQFDERLEHYLHGNVTKKDSGDVVRDPNSDKHVPMKIRWRNVTYYFLIHLGAVTGLFALPHAHYYTYMCALVLAWFNGLGITAGVHRLWSHRAYRAKLPLRIFLIYCQTLAIQNCAIEWCRDHRLHHKYSETDADPHNAKRGFFFAHIGWLMVRKHPKVKEMGQYIDVSDLENDPVLAFQRKYYKRLVVLLCFVMPTLVPWYFWGESMWNAYFICGLLRYVIMLHVTWNVNSAAHLFGNKPYDKRIFPTENFLVNLGAIGEGFHNYHHTFPFDYAASEWGLKFNPTTVFIDFMAAIGLVDQRRRMSPDAITRRKERTGDGTTGYQVIKSVIPATF